MTSHERFTFPPYSYVPGGRWPHPTAAPAGHSSGRVQAPAEPIREDRWEDSEAYLRGIALFNAGYYWEAHESWELLWHAHGRRGPVADILQGLIKLAAAGVKVREERPGGVRTHAGRAALLFEKSRRAGRRFQLGLDLVLLAQRARAVAEAPPAGAGQPDAPVHIVFDFQVVPE